MGNVIKLDGNSHAGLVGHFARALVEVDLSAPLLDSVRVGRPNHLFFVEFGYENLPQICSFCKFVGHSVERCRRAKAANETPEGQILGARSDAEDGKEPKIPPRQQKKWQEKKNGKKQVEQPVETSNPYAALQDLEVEDANISDNATICRYLSSKIRSFLALLERPPGLDQIC